MRRQKVKSSGHILKLEIIFQYEAKQQHKFAINDQNQNQKRIETYSAYFKRQSRRFFNANYSLKKNSTLVIIRQKVRTTGNNSEK
jgi:hypothetical protein